MPNIDITDDITDVIPDGGTADVTDDSTPDQPIDSDVDDDADREPDDYDQTDAEDMGTGGDPIPPDSTPPAEELPEPVPVARTILQAEFISDYSAANLAQYEQSGAVPYAVYDDGTERQVTWADVSDPTPAPVVIESEAAEVAAATNQHFWQNSTDPSTYGGAGVHVTDDEKDAWVQAVAAGFPDIATKPWHNILINSLGILLRTGLRNLVSITKSAIAFFDGNGNAAANIVARFGADGYQVGQDSESHMVGDYHSLQLLDNFNYPYFHVSDLRDRNRIHAYTVTLYPTEFQNYDTLKPYSPIYGVNGFDVNCTVLLSGEPYTGTVTPIYDDPDGFFLANFGWRPIAGVTLSEPTSGHITDWSMTVISESSFETAMTFGFRDSGSLVSGGSVVLGCNNGASGYFSLATGFNTHAVGAFSSASGLRSDAQGMGADASGYNTLASGAYSHAEGREAEASGMYSHAQNYGTIAASDNQTAIGKHNAEDANDTYALIIGNGTADNDRSNALAVTWTGIVETVGAKLSSLLEAARAVITKASGDTSTNALTVNDGTNDVLAVTWDGAAIMQAWAGVIQMFAGSTPPSGWLICDGSAVSRTTYAALFAAIGTTWGAGDGSTTFNIPDLRGRAPIGAGKGSGLTARTLGAQNIGEETHKLTINEMPKHGHKSHYYSASGGSGDGVQFGSTYKISGDTESGSMIVRTGGDGAHNNMQPSAVVNFIIHTGKF